MYVDEVGYQEKQAIKRLQRTSDIIKANPDVKDMILKGCQIVAKDIDTVINLIDKQKLENAHLKGLINPKADNIKLKTKLKALLDDYDTRPINAQNVCSLYTELTNLVEEG